MDNKKFEQLIDLIINENEELIIGNFYNILITKSDSFDLYGKVVTN